MANFGIIVIAICFYVGIKYGAKDLIKDIKEALNQD